MSHCAANKPTSGADVTVKRNLAVGVSRRGGLCPGAGVPTWQSPLPLTDFRGRRGKAGQTYHAWQLPNNYFGPHAY
ncbi:MAG: hypothetical protein IPL78_35710 [Chloroflexi bacterium]|nr:hypothetical protein [Chloroflexota bacterium]